MFDHKTIMTCSWNTGNREVADVHDESVKAFFDEIGSVDIMKIENSLVYTHTGKPVLSTSITWVSDD